jgi:hypothetical protein
MMEQESVNAKTNRICSEIMRGFKWANGNKIWNLVMKVVTKYRDIDFDYKCIFHKDIKGELLDVFSDETGSTGYWIRFTKISDNSYTMWLHIPYNDTKITTVYDRIIYILNKIGVTEEEQRRIEVRQIVMMACDRSGRNKIPPRIVFSDNELNRVDCIPIEIGGIACKATLSQEIICEEGISQNFKIYIPYVNVYPFLTQELITTYGFNWDIARILALKVKKIMQNREIILDSAYRNYSQFLGIVYNVGFTHIPNLLSGLQISGVIACIDKRNGKLLVYKQI